MKKTILLSVQMLAVTLFLLWAGQAQALNAVADYQSVPPFISKSIRPLTMLILDSSGSMGWDAYSGGYDPNHSYYGLFEPELCYGENSGGTATCDLPIVSGGCSTDVPSGNYYCDISTSIYSSATNCTDSCYEVGVSYQTQACTPTTETNNGNCTPNYGCSVTSTSSTSYTFSCSTTGSTYTRSDYTSASNSCNNYCASSPSSWDCSINPTSYTSSANCTSGCTETLNLFNCGLTGSNYSSETDCNDRCSTTVTGTSYGTCSPETYNPDCLTSTTTSACTSAGGTCSTDTIWQTVTTTSSSSCTDSGGTYTPATGTYYYPNATTSADCIATTPNMWGNKLNFDLMARLDVAKKVLTGGQTADVAGLPGVVGRNAVIQLPAGKIARGLVQDNDNLPLGFEVYNSSNGGRVVDYIGTDNATIVIDINSTTANGNTPLAESVATGINYFKQATRHYSTQEYTISNQWDPFYDNASGTLNTCGQASMIVITDGDPTADDSFPAVMLNAASGTAFSVGSYYVDDVSYYGHTTDLRTDIQGKQSLDLYYVWAFGDATAALAAPNLQKASILGGFDDKPQPPATTVDGKPSTVAVENAALFKDREWDFDHNTVPDNYAQADVGDELAATLQNMLGAIESKSSSASAASVISNSRTGEGAMYQAVFFPSRLDSLGNKLVWSGDVHALWVDKYGNLREDCDNASPEPPALPSCDPGDQDFILDLKKDVIIEFIVDSTTNSSSATRYQDLDGNGKKTKLIESGVELAAINYLWSGGEWLAKVDPVAATVQRSYGVAADSRYIFTSINNNQIDFNAVAIRGQLDSDAEFQAILNAADVAEAGKIVNYVRGQDQVGFRERQYDWDNNLTAETYKLGDVVGSTPTLVSSPAEDYDAIYGDLSYNTFKQAYADRRHVIYAGANDGGLHAFNAGYFDIDKQTFLRAPGVWDEPSSDWNYGATTYDMGSEMWMYVPQNVLPHLKWLTDLEYQHTYYVDLKPYIFDARIFTPSATHPEGWGTILLGGLRFGGGDFETGIDIDNDALSTNDTTHSSYFLFDVTNPEAPPVLLREFTDAQLGFTYGKPTAVPMLRCVGDVDCDATGWPMDWYLAFGSGPHHATTPTIGMEGRSDREAYLYLMALGGTADAGGLGYVDVGANNLPKLVTGYPKKIYNGGVALNNAFVSDVVAVDWDLDYRANALYFGTVENSMASPSNQSGGMYRLVIEAKNVDNNLGVDLDPTKWAINTFYHNNQPVVSAPNVTLDGEGGWLFYGTGRYFNPTLDVNNSQTQSFYGLKEELFIDPIDQVKKVNLGISNGGNLRDVTNVNLSYATDAVALESVRKQFADLVYTGTTYDGWYIDLDADERNLSQAVLLGQAVLFTTYTPTLNVCEPGGSSKIWASYYSTGTTWFKPIITSLTGEKSDASGNILRSTSLGSGLASTPNVHRGSGKDAHAYIQTSSGGIIAITEDPPGQFKSGIEAWIGDDL
ncbi:MAG: hypothetical protein KJ950_01300 [Proteobacteria bacterium]|nr:hypothetical protein [Pseudomonadota bacterium]MBU1686294.1 hypothetical protein [Pseudomonadota bacterium]